MQGIMAITGKNIEDGDDQIFGKDRCIVKTGLFESYLNDTWVRMRQGYNWDEFRLTSAAKDSQFDLPAVGLYHCYG